jgi:hypothetical protein
MRVAQVSRCIVCCLDVTANQRSVSRTFGGEDGEMTIRVGYCADRAECGEDAAVNLIEILAAPFIAADVRRDGIRGIQDIYDD